uniref:Nudix hydrolase domain-containing protein n=1 Tax=Triticum urartu TaxID=4572 RepID=A0A8R7UDM0_TRIUA
FSFLHLRFAGEVALPGGKAEEGDADDAATTLREAKEEIGLDSALVTVVSSLEHFLPKLFRRCEGLVFDDLPVRSTSSAPTFVGVDRWWARVESAPRLLPRHVGGGGGFHSPPDPPESARSHYADTTGGRFFLGWERSGWGRRRSRLVEVDVEAGEVGRL